ncbi:hypothetical protein [uncultured Clostridium sp.]|uniref:hypothetical protein n=1 Tax=uncultured Clostridium sp. TaxID=59620 RepID=UPI002631740D|nr:hypothetical protein [uncultured Clostridium sp.]
MVKKGLLGIILISGLLVGCGNSKIADFENEIKNENLKLASDIYLENKGDKDFKDKADSLVEDEFSKMLKYLNADNYEKISDELDVIKEFYNGIELLDIEDEIEKFKDGNEVDKEIVVEEENKLTEKKKLEAEVKKLEDEKAKKILEEELKVLEEKKKSLEAENKLNDSNQGNSGYGNFYYETYVNGRYGFSIQYPSFLTETEYPQNGDGVTIETVDRSASLSIWGSNNVLNDTTQSLYNEMLSSTSGVGYKFLGKTSFVITWNEGSSTYYHCTKVGSGSTNSFTIKSPIKDKDIFDPIITKLYESFNSGDLSLSW